MEVCNRCIKPSKEKYCQQCQQELEDSKKYPYNNEGQVLKYDPDFGYYIS